jgi:hypothetical protein
MRQGCKRFYFHHQADVLRDRLPVPDVRQLRRRDPAGDGADQDRIFPLANKSYASMAKMKAVQPQMMELRDRFKDDKQKQQRNGDQLNSIGGLAVCGKRSSSP